ncbi:hypothetical protein FQN52_007327 [Onygenales sp. PD_12]|nr:hypothetical protein FQN52_007327 [Onygenales sp. PD_12]
MDEGVSDTVLPSRKRRRPALACEQCRRRKIKCDQKMPCDQCQKSKITLATACTYTSIAASVEPPARPYASPPPQPPSINPPVQENRRSGRSSVYPSPLTASLSRQSPRLDDQASEGSWLSVRSSTATIQALVERVQLLEKKLSDATNSSSGAISQSPAGRSSGTVEAPQAVKGMFMKTRFFGQSHWMNCLREANEPRPKFNVVYSLRDRLETDESSELYSILMRCKALGRADKISRPIQPIPAGFKDLVPPRETADELVRGYLRTFESVFRILHVPTFEQEYAQYWNNQESANQAFEVRLLLIMAIGTCFYRGPDRSIIPRKTAAPWIYAAQSWLGSPSEKSRVNVSGVQIHCLLLLARQTCAIDGDLVWISAGSLLRTAMYVGLHHDPKYSPKMSTFQAELRRRLWATVLEIVLQSSMDCGGSPLISLEDFDCEPPLNIDDSQMTADETTKIVNVPYSTDKFTQTTVQVALMRTFPIRLEIARLMNKVRSEPSYNEVLKLSTELISVSHANSNLLQLPPSPHSTHPSTFQVESLALLTNRFLLALHHPFVFKARRDPQYYFSRKTCLDASLRCLSPTAPRREQNGDACSNTNHANSKDEDEDDDFTRLTIHAGSFIRSTFIFSMFAVCIELLHQLQQDTSTIFLPTTPSQRQELHAATEHYMWLAKRRVQTGETNVKGYVVAAGIMAHIQALEEGDPAVERRIMERGRIALELCYTWMKDRMIAAGGSVEGKGASGDAEGSGVDGCDWDGELGSGGVQWEDFDSQFLTDIPDSWLFSSWMPGMM